MSRWVFLLLPLMACVETGVQAVPDTAPLRDEDPDNTVEPLNPDAPVADAGEDRPARPLQDVVLDGSRSYDPNGLDIYPTWTLIEVPKGSQASIDRADAFDPTFFADLAGVYRIQLQVQNSDGLVDATPDEVEVHVQPSESVYLQLTWDEPVDLDLHVVPEGEALWGPLDCNWCNMQPEWGWEGVTLDDGSLDADAIEGFGPETITIDVPVDGRYTAVIDYYGQGGDIRCRDAACPQTEAALDLYVDGRRVHRMTKVLGQAGELWTAFTVDWPEGAAYEIDQVELGTLDDCQD